jgi:hypothetical protein
LPRALLDKLFDLFFAHLSSLMLQLWSGQQDRDNWESICDDIASF